MHHVVLAFVLLLAGISAAHADGRAFPPDNCSSGNPYMGFSGIDGSNTFCNSGQDIFANALPTCNEGEYVARRGGKFVCVALIPSCGPKQYITGDGAHLYCVDAPDTNRYGGVFTQNIDGGCRYPNPITGTCSCPAGFNASQSFDYVNGNCANGYYSDGSTHGSTCGVVQYQCVR